MSGAWVIKGVRPMGGAPTDLYKKPKNLFVANFLGAANIFEGTVMRDGGRQTFASGDLRWALLADHLGKSIRYDFQTGSKLAAGCPDAPAGDVSEPAADLVDDAEAGDA